MSITHQPKSGATLTGTEYEAAGAHLGGLLATDGGQDTIKSHGDMGSTETVSPSDGNVHTGTLDADCVVTLAQPTGAAACTIELVTTQGGTGGHSISFVVGGGGSLAWANGSSQPPVLTAAGVVVRWLFESLDGGDTWLGAVASGYQSDWDYAITKVSDATVTNSTSLTNDADLHWAVGSTDEMWRFEVMVLYDGTLSGDFKCDLGASTGTFSAVFRYLGSDTTANAVLVSTGIRDSGVSSTTDIAAGGTSSGTTRIIHIEGFVYTPSTDMVLTFRFAQNSAVSGESAVLKAGSTLRVKRLA